MIINTYNPSTMALAESDVTGLDFGDVVKGQHNSEPVVIKPELEFGDSFSQLSLYLEAVNSLTHSQFGKYKNSEAITGLQSGGDYLSDNFVAQPGISDFFDFESTSDAGLILDPDNPEYIWMDVQAGTGESSGEGSINFRFVFEYV